MTRCISCTRCVRFTTEVAAFIKWARPGRGEDAENLQPIWAKRSIRTYRATSLICAPWVRWSLKPYAFTARPWELSKTESIDVMDALGSNIRVDNQRPRSHALPAAATTTA